MQKYTITEKDIKYGTHLFNNLFRFELQTPFKHKTGSIVNVEFDTQGYSGIVLYRNRQGNLIEISFREEYLLCNNTH